MTPFFIYLIAALLLGCTASSAVAQTAVLRGTVTNAETGEVISGANVVLTSTERKTGATTSPEGTFEVKGVPEGIYKITVSYIGFAEKVMTGFELRAGGIKVLDISLIPVALELNPLTISASRREERLIEAPAAVSMVERREIETKAVLSTMEHIKGMPGVDVVNSGISQDRVVSRGFNGAISGRLLTLADHRIINLPANRWIVSQLVQPVNEDIERMEMVSGPGSALYGPNSAGGVLHIITKSPFESPGTTVSVGVGERNLLMGSFRHAGMFNKRVGYKISSRYYQATDWKFFHPTEPDSVILGRQTPTGRVNIGGKISNEPDFDMVNISGDGRLDFRLDNGLEVIFSGGVARTSNGMCQVF